MKHKHLVLQSLAFLLFFAPAMSFISCDDDEPISEVTKKRIKSILVKDCSIVKDENGTNMSPVDYYIRLEYDEQNRLVKYTNDYSSYLSVTTLTYSADEVTMEVDGRALGKHTLNALGYAEKFERNFTKPCTYEYDSSGYMVKSDNGESTNTYQYKDGNLVSWASGNISGTFAVSKTKDKMDGPAYYHPLRYYIKGYAEVLPAYMAGLFGETPQYLPKSGERVFTLGENETIYSLTLEYEFDKDGYVTRQTENYSSGSIEGDMYFEYEEVDSSY